MVTDFDTRRGSKLEKKYRITQQSGVEKESVGEKCQCLAAETSSTRREEEGKGVGQLISNGVFYLLLLESHANRFSRHPRLAGVTRRSKVNVF